MSRYHTHSVFPQRGERSGWGIWEGGCKTTQKQERLFPWKVLERRAGRYPAADPSTETGGRRATGEHRPRPLRAPSLATRRDSGPVAPPRATHRPPSWPAGQSIVARAPARAAAARKSSLGQPSRKAEKRNMESKHGRRTTVARLVFCLAWLIRSVLQCSLKGQMADERT